MPSQAHICVLALVGYRYACSACSFASARLFPCVCMQVTAQRWKTSWLPRRIGFCRCDSINESHILQFHILRFLKVALQCCFDVLRHVLLVFCGGVNTQYLTVLLANLTRCREGLQRVESAMFSGQPRDEQQVCVWESERENVWKGGEG